MSSRELLVVQAESSGRQEYHIRLDGPAIRDALAARATAPGVPRNKRGAVEHYPLGEQREAPAGSSAPGVPPLQVFYMYLTQGCNLACQHCWVTPSYMTGGGTGGHVELSRLLEACRNARPLGLQAVKLTGGEPLLYPDFVALVYGLRELGLGVWMESNMTLLTPAKAVAIVDTMTFFSTSLDAATALDHDAFRGARGSFAATCEAVRLLAPHVHVQVIMSVHSGNVDQVEDLIRLAQGLGARSVKFNLIRSSGRADQMRRNGRTLDVQHLIAVGRLVQDVWEPKYGLRLQWDWPPAFVSLRNLTRGPMATCGIHNILGILGSGHYALCGIGQTIDELIFGTLEDNLEAIWTRHPMLHRLRVELPDQLEGVCGQCMLKRTCKAHCIAQNYHENHSLRQAHWFCQEAYEQGLFPASRLIPSDTGQAADAAARPGFLICA
jgi:SynChlorMet cassette radical SAM/SPASM protein ScmF